MDTKLTLKLNSRSINRAKKYIHRQKSSSLSKLVETYFNSLTSRVDCVEEESLPPIVSSLAGIISRKSRVDAESEYTDYLIEKYK